MAKICVLQEEGGTRGEGSVTRGEKRQRRGRMPREVRQEEQREETQQTKHLNILFSYFILQSHLKVTRSTLMTIGIVVPKPLPSFPSLAVQ